MTGIDAFLGGIGVNTHVDATSTPYGNVTLTAASLAYLGVSLIRDHAYDIDLDAYRALAAGGVKLNLILDDDPQAEIDALLPVAGAIATFEGPNEVDYQPILTNGIADPVLAAVTEQNSIRAAIARTSAVAAIPLIDASVADPANLSRFGDTLLVSDIANLHAYSAFGASPRAVLEADLAAARRLSNKPVVVTETGYNTLTTDIDGVDEGTQARLTLDTLFDTASLGIGRTFLYELFDEADDPAGTEPERHYGLFHTDGSPKLAATALHNVTSILAAANATAAPAPTLTITTDALPATGRTLVLTGAAGTSVVAIWAEPTIWDATAHAAIAAPTVQTTVHLGTTAGTAAVYDPLLGTAPIATYANVSSVTVGLTDHPLLISMSAPVPVRNPVTSTTPPISFTPATPSPAVSPPPAAVRTTAVYRFFDTALGTHFYTADPAEAALVRQTRPDLVPEGVGLRAIDPAGADPNAVTVYRFFDTRNGTHFFTADAAERDTVAATRPDLLFEANGTFLEHAVAQPGDKPVFRFFDKDNGTHFYTDDPAERAAVIDTRPDLVAEGIGFYEPGDNA